VSVDSLFAGLRWKSRGKLRFWVAVTLMLVVQATVVGLVPFGDESMPAPTLLVPALVIYLFDECIMFLLLIGRKPAAESK